VHGVEGGLHGLQVFLAFTYAGKEGIHLFLGGDETGYVHPHSGADGRRRAEHLSQIFLTGTGGKVPEAGDDGVAKEFDDGGAVVADALAEGGVADFGAVVGVDIGQFTGGVLKVPEELRALYHFLDGEGGEEVVVDAVQAVGVLAGVALGPFLGVADGAHAPEVHARNKVCSVLLLNEVGERKVCGVRVRDVAAHDKGEGAYTGGPEDIGIGRCLGAALHNALMDGPQLVHVVTLVGAASGVHEREHAGNEEGALVVGDGERAGENGAGLAVFPLAVGEEEAVRCGVAVPQGAALSHEAALQGGVVVDGGAGADNEIVRDDAMAYLDGGGLVGADGAVAEAGGAAYLGPVANVYSVDILGITDADVVADAASGGFLRCGIIVNHPVKGGDGVRVVAVHGKDVCRLGGEAVEDLDFAAAGFVEDAYLYAVSEAAGAVREDQVNVLDVTVGPYVVIGDVVRDVLHQGIVPYGDVVEGYFAKAGVLLEAAREGEIRLEAAEFHFSGEADVADVFEGFRV